MLTGLCIAAIRLESTTTIYPADVVLFEGILMFYQKEIRDLFHMKLFVDSDADTRLARRGQYYYSAVGGNVIIACMSN